MSKKVQSAPAGSRAFAAPAWDSVRALFSWVNKYTGLTTTAAGRRPAPEIERGNEERTQIKPYDRLNAIAMGRNLERNNSKAIAIIEQLKVMTAGRVKAQLNTPDTEWNKKAGERFNVHFARDCYYAEPMNLAEAAQLIEASKVREGDVLVAFDDFLEGPHGSGKLMVWEADQLVNVEKNDWESPTLNPYWRETVTLPDGSTVSRPCFQDQGVVTNRRGKVLAYIVTSRHVADERRGYLALPISEVLVLPVRCCRLVKRRFRFGQRRGVPNLLNVAEDLADIDEMIKSELATAAVRAKLMAIVKHSSENANAEQDVQLEKMLAAVSGKGSAADTPTPEPKQLKTYKNIESVTGGCTEYLEEGDEMLFPDINRPNLDVSSFYDHRGDSAGASVGLARGFTRLSVGNSYTAHRGETGMTWKHIRNRQKLNEWNWLDWLAVRVLERDIVLGLLPPGPENWQTKISWAFPEPDPIDPQKEALADHQKQKNGNLDFRELLGPDWREKFEALADQIEYARSLNLPLSILETVAGAVMDQPQTTEENEG